MSFRVNHNLIEKDHPGCKVLQVEEYYKPGIGFTSTLPDGNYCFDNDLSVDDAIIQIFKAGGTSVNLKILTKKNKTVYEDYHTKSLLA